MVDADIREVPVLSDNYVWLLHDPSAGATAAVDPAVAEPVRAALDRLGWSLTHILLTHHHHDHVGGVDDLKAATGCTVIGARDDARRLPGLDRGVGDGDEVTVGTLTGRVLTVPGHTSGHVAYHFAGARALFCGDTLFALGCGRLFEGTPATMWASLKRLRDLDDDTRVYCAHEYTLNNAHFATEIDPDNDALRRRLGEIEARRRDHAPTLPVSLGVEKATNPFLRADDPALARAVGLGGRDPEAVFAEIRRRKDRF